MPFLADQLLPHRHVAVLYASEFAIQLGSSRVVLQLG